MSKKAGNKSCGTVIQPKKTLGQHFLVDKNIATKTVNALKGEEASRIIEVGSGTGMISQFLFERFNGKVYLIELDIESIKHLYQCFSDYTDHIYHEDFLKCDLRATFNPPVAIIGSFPYNISSQIFFKVLDNRDIVDETVGMIQKEAAERIVAPPGNRTYGMLSVLLQAFYDVSLNFKVSKNVFIPPPNVESAVIRLKRNERSQLGCNEAMFFTLVKTAFSQRRKTLRNSLKRYLLQVFTEDELLSRRPEELSVDEFVKLTNIVENQ